jgi:hypothetical protein
VAEFSHWVNVHNDLVAAVIEGQFRMHSQGGYVTAPGAEPNTPMEQQRTRAARPAQPRRRPIRPARWASMVGALLVAAIAALAS